MTKDRATALLCAACALVLLWIVWSFEPPVRPDPPYWTPVVIITTATPPPVTVSPVQPRRATPSFTPYAPFLTDPVIRTPLPTLTATPVPTVTSTPEPTGTRVPQTPVQKGSLERG